MIHVMQILNILSNKQVNYFEALFEDLSFELEEMGWADDPEGLINDMLDNHLGIYLEDDRQLQMVTECILSKKHESAINVIKLKRGIK